MFKAKTDRIEKLAEVFPAVIESLEQMFDVQTNIYIDWQNVIHWQDKLGWHFSAKRLKQFFDSFDTIHKVSIYTGTLNGDRKSEEETAVFRRLGYDLHTKPVKIMSYSIRTSSIPVNSPVLLEPFIKNALLSVLNIETIEYLNSQLIKLNKQGAYKIEDKKCNFDVEIGRDIFLDLERESAECFVLWSGDSDFADPLGAVMKRNKQAFLFATSGRVSFELAELRVPIFEIKKIKEFVCWPRELSDAVKSKILL
jgi:uncharacterized LabA/DUF88 family protein